MKTKSIAVIFALLVACAWPARAQNLLLNPSFETGSFVDSGNGFMPLDEFSTSLDNWAVFGESVTLSWGTTPNATGLVASAGTKFLNLAGFHAAPWSGVRQSLVLTSGQAYHVTFDLGTQQSDPQLRGPVAVQVRAGNADGVSLDTSVTFTPTGTNTQWGRCAVDFTAAYTGQHYLSFTANAATRCLGLDNVALTALPASGRHAVADTATWVPGGSNNFTSLPNPPSVSGTGVGFYGEGGAGQKGIYVATPPEPLRVVANLATAIPNGTGNFTAFAPVGLPPEPVLSGNHVAFYGEGLSSQKGIYVGVPGGSPSRIADASTAIPSGAGNFTGFAPVGAPPEPLLSGNNVAFWGQGASSQGIYARLNGPLVRIADTSTAIPAGTGNFTSLASAPMISGNVVAFFGNGSGGQQGLYYLDDGVLEMVVDTTTAIPGGIGNFTSFTGALALGAPQQPPAPIFVGLGSGGQQGVYVKTPADPCRVVADKTTAIPGGTGLFTGFGAVSTDAGIAAFIGTGSGGQSGVYALRSGMLTKVVAVGDVVDGKTVTAVALAARGVSGTGIAYTLSFSDSSQAVFTENLPVSADDFRITGVTRAGTHLRLSHTTQPGFKYVVQATSNLVGGTWSALPGTNTGTGFVIETVVSNALTAAGSKQFYKAQLVAGSFASDSAVDVGYSDGWTDGSTGGAGFGPWILTATGVSGSSSNGFFIGMSTNNAFFGSPGIDVGGESWGIYANGGNNAVAYRTFNGNALAVGQSLLIDMDNGFVDSGQTVGFVLRTGNAASSPSDYNVGARFEFLFIGGGADYQVKDAAGQHDLGVGFSGTGKHLVFKLTGPNEYTLLTIDNATGATNTFFNVLSGTLGTPVESIALYNRNAGSNSDHDAFFNSLEILSP